MERRKTTGNEAELNVLVVDGQGGMVGKQMVEAVRKMIPNAAITAVGTNQEGQIVLHGKVQHIFLNTKRNRRSL